MTSSGAASYESCYRTPILDTKDTIFVTFNLQKPFFIHAVVAVQGLMRAGLPWAQNGGLLLDDALGQTGESISYSYKVILHKQKDWSTGIECNLGGPADPDIIEHWCNAWADYVTIVAHEPVRYDNNDNVWSQTTKAECESFNGNDPSLCDFKLCNVGIFGTTYSQTITPNSSFTVVSDKTVTMDIK